MLGQSCNGEFALGEIEDSQNTTVVAGVACFTADREGIFFPTFSATGLFIPAFEPTAICTVSLAPSAIVTVEIDYGSFC